MVKVVSKSWLESSSFWRNILYVIFIAVIAFQFVQPFLYTLDGHDAPIHLNWLEQFPKLFRNGQLYPRWMPGSFFGFGSPAFYFYPPFVYWLAGCLAMVASVSSDVSFHIVGFLVTVLSVFTGYQFLRSISGSRKGAIIGALFYGVLPYRFVDLYLRNALSEHAAFIFLPLIFLGVEMAIRSERSAKKALYVSILVSTIGWGGLLFTNVPTVLIAIYSVPLYSLARVWKARKFLRLAFPLIGAMLGAMIAAIYLLPANALNSSIQLPFLWNLRRLQGDTGYSVIDVISGNSRVFFLGTIGSLALGVWLAAKCFWGKEPLHRKYPGLAAILVFAIVFQIPYLLLPIWKILPFIDYVQFTWRLDVLFVIASSMYVALQYDESRKPAVWQFIGISSLITFLVAGGFGVRTHWNRNASPERTEAQEYLTSTAKAPQSQFDERFRTLSPDPFLISAGKTLAFHLLSENESEVRFRIDSLTEPMQTIMIHRMYFPTWKLRNEAGDAKQIGSDSIGRMTASLTIGSYRLAIEKSDAEKTGKMISLIGLSLFAGLTLLIIFWRNPKAS